MKYDEWQYIVFSQTCKDSVDTDAPAFNLPLEIALDYVDRSLQDQSMFRFHENQLCCGFELIFSNGFTDYPFAYYRLGDVDRSTRGILNLQFLYSQYFQRFCLQPFSDEQIYSPMLALCYRFWDMFPLFPTMNIPAQCIEAGLDVMESTLKLPNPHCVASSLQGIAWWSYATSLLGNERPRKILLNWRSKPTFNHPDLIAFGNKVIEGWLD